MIFIDNKNTIFTAKGLFRASQLHSNIILKTYQNKIQIVDSISSVNVKGKNITLENGESFFLADVNSVLTTKGISKVEQVKEGCYLGFKSNSFFSPTSNKEIDWKDELRTNAIPIRVPSSMDNKIAYWMGLYSARGFLDEINGKISFNVENNKGIKEILIKLTKEIFDVTPDDVINHNSKNVLSFPSSNVKRFLKKQLGSKRIWKKVPSLIQESSIDEQLSYIAGLSYKSYQEKEKNPITFSSGSSLFMSYLSSLLKNLGFIISRKSTKSGHGSLVHYINITGITREIPFDELKKQEIHFNPNLDFSKLKNKALVKIPKLDEVKIRYDNPSISVFKRVKKSKQELTFAYILDNWNIPYENEIYYIKVKSIEEIEKQCTSISLKNKGGLLLENLIIFE